MLPLAAAAELARETARLGRGHGVHLSLPPRARGVTSHRLPFGLRGREPARSLSSGEQCPAFEAGSLLSDLYQETRLGDIQCPFVFVFIFLARLMYLKDILSLWFTGIRRGLVQVVMRGPGSP